MEKQLMLIINPSEEFLLIKRKEMAFKWKCRFLNITDISQSSFYRGKSLFIISEPEHYCLTLKDKSSIKLLENYLSNNTLPDRLLILSIEPQTSLKKIIVAIKQQGGTIEQDSSLLDSLELPTKIKEYFSTLDSGYSEKVLSNLLSLSKNELNNLTINEINSWLAPQEKVAPMWEIVDKILLGQSTVGLTNWEKHKTSILIYPFLSYLKKSVVTIYIIKTLGYNHPGAISLMGKKVWFYKKIKVSTDIVEKLLLEILLLENNLKGGSTIEPTEQISLALLKISNLIKKDA